MLGIEARKARIEGGPTIPLYGLFLLGSYVASDHSILQLDFHMLEY